MDFKTGDMVSVDGNESYAKIISIEPMGEYHKIGLFYPELKEEKSLVYGWS